MKDQQGLKISVFSRVLAWILVVACLIAVVGLLAMVLTQRAWPLGVVQTLFLALAVFYGGPLFFRAAWFGRASGRLGSVERVYDDEARKRGLDPQTTARARPMVAVGSALVFGAGILGFGSLFGVFSDGSGPFPVVVFAIVWLVVAILLWRFFNKRPGDETPSARD